MTAQPSIVQSPLPTIPVSLIDPSPTQPRKTFTGIEEMAENIKVHGILQPLLLRPFPKKPGRYELVFGERRFRGGKLAGLKEVPAIVREIGDAEVVEIQIVENAKRSDIHPLEEAAAYECLHKKHGYSIEDIAAKVGKSTATIYSRLRFSTLVPEARKAFLEGTISAAIAVQLVRIPHVDLQKEAFKAITERCFDGEPPTARDATDVIEREFMMTLGKAPFDTNDATLLEKVPACATCPKRTGNQGHLFADASSKDLCTDTKCFKAKTEADWSRKADKAKKRKLPVLEGKKAQEALSHSSNYVDLDRPNYDDKRQRTYRECLTKTKTDIPIVLARDTEGAARELVNRKDLQKIGVVKREAPRETTADVSLRKHRDAEKKKRENAASVVEQLVEKSWKVRNEKFELALGRALAAGAARLVWHDTAKMICARREIEVVKNQTPIEALVKYAGALDIGACRSFIVEVVASRDETRSELAELFKVEA